MSYPFPTPAQSYPLLPYRFPLIENFQPLVKIPVVGPEPFNTLVVVRGRVFTVEYGWADDVLHGHQFAVGTNFKLETFDRNVPPPFRHSTTAVLNMIQQNEDETFVTAVNEVDGFFNDAGYWIIVARVASQWDQVFASSTAYLSSWVLCYEKRPEQPEPPPKVPRGERSKFENYDSPPRFWSIERDSPPSDADRKIRRFLKQSRRRRGRKLTREDAEKSSATVSGEQAPTLVGFPASTADVVPVVIPPVKLRGTE